MTDTDTDTEKKTAARAARNTAAAWFRDRALEIHPKPTGNKAVWDSIPERARELATEWAATEGGVAFAAVWPDPVAFAQPIAEGALMDALSRRRGSL